MYNIRVNSIILDLPPESVFVLNSLILDFNNIMGRGVTSSNTFKALLTQNNNRALEYPAPINSTSQAWTKLFPAEIMLGKNAIATGSVKIKSAINGEVSLQFQDASRDFYDNLNRQASDIDFSTFDLEFGSTTFAAIANITAGQIWAYKKMQCAINGTSTDFEVFNRPSYSVRELLREFCEAAGFTIDFSQISDSTEIDSLLLTAHADSFLASDFRQRYIEETFSGTTGVPDTLPIDTNDFSAISSAVNLDTIKNTDFPYSLNIKGTVVANGSVSIRVTNSAGDTETISIVSGTSFINFTTSLYEPNSITEIEIVGEVIFRDVFLYMILNEKDIADTLGTWESGSGGSILGSYYFLGAHNLPNMTQLDLLRVLWSVYFVQANINTFRRELSLELFGQTSELSHVDITQTLADEGSTSPARMFARQNLFTYSNDGDTFPDYAQFIFRAEGDSNAPIKNYIKLPFAASVNKEYGGFGSLARVEVYNRASFSESESRTELTNRLLLENGGNAVFERLSWGYLYETYYAGVFNRITQKRYNTKMFMTFETFQMLNDVGFVFIRNKGSFFIEKIQAFQEGEPVKINLIFLR